MSNELGDRSLGHGDQDTRLNNTGAALEAGYFVVPDGDESVGLADAAGAGDALVGVTGDPILDGDTGLVHYRGIVLARVASDVAAGDELAAPDSAAAEPGTPGVAEAGGASGIYALEGAQDDGTGAYFAPVLLR